MEAITCKNCRALTFGEYCNKCGQPTKTGRIDSWYILEEIAAIITNFNRKGYTFTMWKLIKSPGTTIDRYINGERSKFQNPLGYLAFAIFLTYLISSRVLPKLNHHTEFYPGRETVQGITIILIMSFFNFLVIRISKCKKLSYWEVITANCFVYGTILIFNLFVSLPLDYLKVNNEVKLAGMQVPMSDLLTILLHSYMYFFFFRVIGAKLVSNLIFLSVIGGVIVYELYSWIERIYL